MMIDKVKKDTVKSFLVLSWILPVIVVVYLCGGFHYKDKKKYVTAEYISELTGGGSVGMEKLERYREENIPF